VSTENLEYFSIGDLVMIKSWRGYQSLNVESSIHELFLVIGYWTWCEDSCDSEECDELNSQDTLLKGYKVLSCKTLKIDRFIHGLDNIYAV
jgi:hypothetical protein